MKWLRTFENAKFSAKSKILKHGTKNVLFRCFTQQFWKTIVIFEITALEFALLQSLLQKKKSLNLEPKMPDLRYFGLELRYFGLEYYFHFWNQFTRICLDAKFRVKTNICKFGNKSAFFEYF